MSATAHEQDKLLECLSALSELPLQNTDRSTALRRITELGRQALESYACALTLVDLDNRTLSYGACAGANGEFEKHLAGKTFWLGSRKDGDPLDHDVFSRGGSSEEPIAFYNLQEDGQGVARSDLMRQFGLCSLLAVSLKSEGRLIGYFNHFTRTAEPFTSHDRTLLKIFARQAMTTIDRFDSNRIFERSLGIRNRLTKNLRMVPGEDFLKNVCKAPRILLKVPVCIVWKLDEQQGRLKVAATYGVDDAYRKIELERAFVLEHLSDRKVRFLSDVTQRHPKYQHSEEAKNRNWVSLLTAPMWFESRLIGMLDVYTTVRRHFKKWEKKSYGDLANYAALAIQKMEEFTRHLRLKRLNEIIGKMSEIRDLDVLLKSILDGALELVACGDPKWGSISRLDFTTGKLRVDRSTGEQQELPSLDLGKGITGQALKEGRPIRVPDVRTDEYKNVFVEFWPKTRAELAVPILLEEAEVRVGQEVRRAPKRIGVLNVESPIPNAFTQADEELLLLLARQSAPLIERFESERKATGVAQVERELLGKKDWDEILDIVMRAIRDTLGYDIVNFSLVIPEANLIATERFVGIDKAAEDRFKRLARHALDSDDIQAHIYRSRIIEAPASDDPRYDPKIYEEFGQRGWLRVFVPMIITSENRVIGTMEVGYKGVQREHIYESDVLILKNFVEYATLALEQRKKGLLDCISHEFTQAIVGVRNNASYLQRHLDELIQDKREEKSQDKREEKSQRKDKIQRKLEDILLDGEILLQQVAELEYVLGREPRVSKKDRTVVMRDVVIKTINQLKPLMLERDFDTKRVYWDEKDIHRIVIFVDRAKLNQVVYNLLTNAIKYAEKDPSKFAIRIKVDESREHFVLRFKDWGIGIEREFGEKIFENGFRTPEAIDRHVAGSGLGLTIARKAIKDIGGELKLASKRKPTEFHIILPKHLREEPR